MFYFWCGLISLGIFYAFFIVYCIGCSAGYAKGYEEGIEFADWRANRKEG